MAEQPKAMGRMHPEYPCLREADKNPDVRAIIVMGRAGRFVLEAMRRRASDFRLPAMPTCDKGLESRVLRTPQ